MSPTFGGKHEVIVEVTAVLSGSGCHDEVSTAINAQISGSAAVFDSVHGWCQGLRVTFLDHLGTSPKRSQSGGSVFLLRAAKVLEELPTITIPVAHD